MTFTIPRVGTLVEATVDHADRLTLNPEDAAECFAFGPPGEALRDGVRDSMEAWTWLVDGKPAVMFGVCYPMIAGFARPWCLSGRGVRANPLPFLIGCRDYVRHIGDRYRRLESQVDARYKQSVSWVRWLGFTVDDQPRLISGVPFLNFSMVKP